MDQQANFNQAEHDHLARGGTVYYFGATWKESPYFENSVRLGPFFNAEDGEAALVRCLLASSYHPPKWWEYWRWGENRPSKRVLAKLEALMQP